MQNALSPQSTAGDQRERLLRLLALTTFIVFFQGYMVAPIIPLLSAAFHAPEQITGMIIPAYLIPYGIATLICGLLADRIGIHRVMFSSLAIFSVLTILTATAQSVEQLTWLRIATGVGASGVVPLSLALVGRLYPYEHRGRALGWLFGAMAGGMAIGSPLGALLVPLIGWRSLAVQLEVEAIHQSQWFELFLVQLTGEAPSDLVPELARAIAQELTIILVVAVNPGKGRSRSVRRGRRKWTRCPARLRRGGGQVVTHTRACSAQSLPPRSWNDMAFAQFGRDLANVDDEIAIPILRHLQRWLDGRGIEECRGGKIAGPVVCLIKPDNDPIGQPVRGDDALRHSQSPRINRLQAAACWTAVQPRSRPTSTRASTKPRI